HSFPKACDPRSPTLVPARFIRDNADPGSCDVPYTWPLIVWGKTMTFSIAGRCARTGMLGAVVTTSAMAVGSRCACAEAGGAAGVGAALTQHRTDPRLGPVMLAELKRGRAPEAIMQELEARDKNLKWRQLALVAADGRGAFFNGAAITSIAKGSVGRDCVA